MSDKPHDPPPRAPTLVPSPCIQVCRLDADLVCVGCARTLDEIARWGQMTGAERQAVIERGTASAQGAK